MAIPPAGQSCESCYFWINRRCHAEAPKWHAQPGVVEFPPTPPNEWCGLYKKATGP